MKSIHTRWGEHPDFTHADWADEARADETRLGYWDWVANRIDSGDFASTASSPAPAPAGES